MPRDLILSIDQGTTGSRAFVFNRRGRVISQSYREFKQYYPKPGWVEHDPMEILTGVGRVVREAVRGPAGWKRIAAIGITNQRETVVMWDARTGKPVHRAIVWQCRRTADLCDRLRKDGAQETVRTKTGLVLDPYFSGTKVRWLLDHVPGLRERAKRGGICAGTMDSWLLWNLTGGATHATDFTNASRTLLFNIRTKRWDPDLLRLLGIPALIRLPTAEPSAGRFGVTARFPGIPDGIPISGICGDQQSALFGQGAARPGEIKNTYGTGCFLMLHTGDQFISSKEGLLTTLACDPAGGPAYALEGAVFIAGAAIQWLRDGLRVLDSAAESERLARSVPDAAGVIVVPAFTGLGAPHWNPAVRGAIFGLTRGSSRAHLVRATLESIAFQTWDVFDVMRRLCAARHPPIRIQELRVDGGACRNDFLLQFQSDLLGIPIVRPRQTESTAWGAAKLAGLGAGVWAATAGESRSGAKRFTPSMRKPDARRLIERWQSFVRRLM